MVSGDVFRKYSTIFSISLYFCITIKDLFSEVFTISTLFYGYLT